MVIWSELAKVDLKHIYDFIAQDSCYYASEVAERLVDLTVSLQSFPKQGRVVPELDNSEIRELHLYSYRIIYQTSSENIYIIAIVNMRQKLEKKFFK
jgi:toxin ParE1/3/4